MTSNPWPVGMYNMPQPSCCLLPADPSRIRTEASVCAEARPRGIQVGDRCGPESSTKHEDRGQTRRAGGVAPQDGAGRALQGCSR